MLNIHVNLSPNSIPHYRKDLSNHYSSNKITAKKTNLIYHILLKSFRKIHIIKLYPIRIVNYFKWRRITSLIERSWKSKSFKHVDRFRWNLGETVGPFFPVSLPQAYMSKCSFNLECNWEKAKFVSSLWNCETFFLFYHCWIHVRLLL